MNEQQKNQAVRELAAELYEDRYAYLLRIARRNAATASDAEEALQDAFAYFLDGFDPECDSPPLAWLTLVMKRRCWRLRDAAHLDRRLVADVGSEHQEPSATIERRPSGSAPIAERVAECDEARRRLRRLKPDERTAIGMVAAGCDYEEVGRVRGWTQTKVNRCLYEGRLSLHGTG